MYRVRVNLLSTEDFFDDADQKAFVTVKNGATGTAMATYSGDDGDITIVQIDGGTVCARIPSELLENLDA